MADDNRDAAESLALLLELHGHDVRVAADGVEAVQAAERFRPDAVVLDLGMPRMNGLEACRHIRAQPWGERIPVIALTGWGQDDVRQRARAAGFDAHFMKTADPNDLLDVLQALVARPARSS